MIRTLSAQCGTGAHDFCPGRADIELRPMGSVVFVCTCACHAVVIVDTLDYPGGRGK